VPLNPRPEDPEESLQWVLLLLPLEGISEFVEGEIPGVMLKLFHFWPRFAHASSRPQFRAAVRTMELTLPGFLRRFDP
jgi:hypothetical protein